MHIDIKIECVNNYLIQYKIYDFNLKKLELLYFRILLNLTNKMKLEGGRNIDLVNGFHTISD